VATRIASMSASHASLTDIPAADVAHTDAKWTPVRNHFGITAFGVNAYTARNTGDRLIGEHDHRIPPTSSIRSCTSSTQDTRVFRWTVRTLTHRQAPL
jgi:hypothetical protein